MSKSKKSTRSRASASAAPALTPVAPAASSRGIPTSGEFREIDLDLKEIGTEAAFLEAVANLAVKNDGDVLSGTWDGIELACYRLADRAARVRGSIDRMRAALVRAGTL